MKEMDVTLSVSQQIKRNGESRSEWIAPADSVVYL